MRPSLSHVITRAVSAEVQRRAAQIDAVSDLSSVRVEVKLAPGTGQIRGVWFALEAGSYAGRRDPSV
jgi:hypothetical protein